MLYHIFVYTKGNRIWEYSTWNTKTSAHSVAKIWTTSMGIWFVVNVDTVLLKVLPLPPLNQSLLQRFLKAALPLQQHRVRQHLPKSLIHIQKVLLPQPITGNLLTKSIEKLKTIFISFMVLLYSYLLLPFSIAVTLIKRISVM